MDSNQSIKFEIRRHDGPGRLGRIQIKSHTLKTPTLVNPVPHISSKINIYDLLNSRNRKHEKTSKIKLIFHTHSFVEKKDYVNDDENYSEFVPTIEIPPLPLRELDRNGVRFLSHLEEKLVKDGANKSSLGIILPNIGDLFSDSIKETLDKINPGLIVLGDCSRFQNHPRSLVRYVIRVNEIRKPNTLVLAPLVHPILMPFLTYLGVDLFDLAASNLASAEGIYFSLEGSWKLDSLPDLPCFCNFCKKREEISQLEFLKGHNKIQTELQLQRIRLSLQKGKLRELIRITGEWYPPIKAALRILDLEYQSLLQRTTPISKRIPLFCSDLSDIWRPEIVRFRERVRKRFFPPEFPVLYVLLPCSAKKPYSKSKSHHFFQGRIKKSSKGYRRVVREGIVTSPLGFVPRELEYTYPAAHYDIPTTGHWTNEEKSMGESAVSSFLENLHPETRIVAHLPLPERSIVENAFENAKNPERILFSEFEGRITSDTALQALDNNIREELGTLNKTFQKENSNLCILRAVADYQFDQGAGEALIRDNSHLIGYIHKILRVRFDGRDICSFSSQKGLLSLTLEGAEILWKLGRYFVHYEGEKIQGSALYVPAIRDADPQIVPGDQVVVVGSNEKVLGVGRSILSGTEIVQGSRGIGIELKAKRRDTN